MVKSRYWTGLGREMRMAALALGFDGLGAEWALSDVWHDNRPSRGVTRSLATRARPLADAASRRA